MHAKFAFNKIKTSKTMSGSQSTNRVELGLGA